VRKGINSRFDDYSGSQLNPVDHPPDTNVKNNITYAQYRDNTSFQSPTHTGVAGRRLVIIPIIKLPNTTRDTISSSSTGSGSSFFGPRSATALVAISRRNIFRTESQSARRLRPKTAAQVML
jgi:hypothetical protein